MSNNNPKGTAKYWFAGSVASAIDNGVKSTANIRNYIGTTNYWHQGTPQGFLQGGPGSVGDSPPNLILFGFRHPIPPKPATRAYAVII